MSARSELPTRTMTVGEQLRQGRLARRRSVGDVSQETKVQPWVLEALEADRLHETMSPIYVKGFVITYARFLELDADALVRQLMVQIAPPTPQEPVLTQTPASLPEPIEIPVALLRRLGAVVVVITGVLALVWVKPWQWLPHVEFPQQASVSIVRDTTPSSIPLPDLPPVTTRLELTIRARRPTWVRITGDGKLLAHHRLAPGAEESWSAKRRFELVIAIPAYAEVSLNGQPITPFVMAHGGRLRITHQEIVPLPEPLTEAVFPATRTSQASE